MTSERTSAPGDIVFVHGMYMNAASWLPWVGRAEDRGYQCHAVSWPYHDGPPAELRAKPAPALGSLTFGEVVDHYKSFIAELPRRPIVIGHSIGGLITQKLVNDGYASAGVVISSAPPQGVVSFDPNFFRANFPHVNPFAGNRPVIMTPSRFHYAFANTLSRQASDAGFEAYVVPESRNVPRSTLTKQARIEFKTDHVPLLFMTGDSDHLTPLAMVRANSARYAPSTGLLEFTEFPNRSHFICNEPGWEDVADHAFEWLARL